MVGLCRVNYFGKPTSWVLLCSSYCIYQEHPRSDFLLLGDDRSRQRDPSIIKLPITLPPSGFSTFYRIFKHRQSWKRSEKSICSFSYSSHKYLLSIYYVPRRELP